jgi:hypothetical protein
VVFFIVATHFLNVMVEQTNTGTKCNFPKVKIAKSNIPRAEMEN